MIRAAGLGAMIVIACILSACGGGTSFDESEASVDSSTSGSPNPIAPEDPDIPDYQPTPGDSDPDEPTTPTPTPVVVSTPTPTPTVTPMPTPTPVTPPTSIDLSSALISWSIPTERENGEGLSLNDIGGYEILYRKTDEVIFSSVIVDDQTQSQRVLEGLPPGQYEFFVLAFDAEGIYSDFSEPAIASIGVTTL